MPNRYELLPGVVIMENLFPSSAFIPLTADLEKQALYQGTKLTAKVVGQKKQVAQAVYEAVWGDFITICKRILYVNL